MYVFFTRLMIHFWSSEHPAKHLHLCFTEEIKSGLEGHDDEWINFSWIIPSDSCWSSLTVSLSRAFSLSLFLTHTCVIVTRSVCVCEFGFGCWLTRIFSLDFLSCNSDSSTIFVRLKCVFFICMHKMVYLTTNLELPRFSLHDFTCQMLFRL